jgi:hypothetical protein
MDADLTVLPADKGNVTVILNTVDYEQKTNPLLEDSTYKELTKNPTDSVERKTTLLLKKSKLAEDICKRLRPTGTRPPRLYRLPKIHKEGIPLRPIISNIGAPTYQMSKYLATLLSPFVGQSIHYVKNSSEFVRTFDSLQLGPQIRWSASMWFLCSQKCRFLDLLGRLFDEDILALFRHVLQSTYFTYGGHFYKQTNGVAMGSPLFPVIADFFMEDFEAKAIQLATNKPTCWFRYVDDTFVIWPHGTGKLTKFLTHLNSINKYTQFTMETDEDNHLTFLDIDIYETGWNLRI